MKIHKKPKIPKSFRFSQDVFEHMSNNNNINNMSKHIENFYKNTEMCLDYKVLELDILISKLNYAEYLYNKYKSNEEINMLFSDIEINWLKDGGLDRIKKFTLKGVFASFIKKFDRDDINIRQFKLFTENIKKVLNYD